MPLGCRQHQQPWEGGWERTGTYMNVSWSGCADSRLCWRPCFHIAPQLRVLTQPSHVWQPGASWQRRLPPNPTSGGQPLPPNPLGTPESQEAPGSLLRSLRLGRSHVYVHLAAALLCGPNSALVRALELWDFWFGFFFFLILCLKLYIVPKFPCFMSLFVTVFES